MTSARVAVPVVALAILVATAGLGLWWSRGRGYELGLPYPPFVGQWDPRVTAWAILAAIVLGAAAWLAPRTLALRPLAFAGVLLGITLAARLTLGASSSGTEQWSRVFDPAGFEGPNEYLPALSALRYGAGFFVDRFAELVPALPVHAAGHPPGLLLVMHALAIDTAGELAALCIGVGSLVAPLTYAVGRALLDERGARVAGLLCALAPSVLLFGATSADAVFATLGLLGAWPLCSPRWPLRALGAVVLAAASLFAWSLLAVGAWAALLALRRRGWRDALALCVLCGSVVLAVHGAFAAATGFDPIGTLQATESVYRFGIADRRPYAYWLLGSPAAFLLMLGVPITWFALRALVARHDLALAVFAVIAAAAVAGFTKAEVERIWLFLAPLVCLAAAGALRPSLLRPVLALLGAQALAWEIAWNTVW